MITTKALVVFCLVLAPLHGAIRPDFQGAKNGVTRVKRIVRQGKQVKELQPSATNSFEQIQQILKVRNQ